MSHEIFLKYFIEYLFFSVQHMVRYCELYDILYNILCKLYILWMVYLIGTYIVQGFDMKL